MPNIVEPKEGEVDPLRMLDVAFNAEADCYVLHGRMLVGVTYDTESVPPNVGVTFQQLVEGLGYPTAAIIARDARNREGGWVTFLFDEPVFPLL